MLKLYYFFKLILLSIVILLFLSIFFYESTKDDLINYSEVPFLKSPLDTYLSVKDFIFYDPNVHDTGLKINKFRKEFGLIFDSAITSVSNIMNDRSFYDNIYFYILSRKMAGMDELVGKFLSPVPSFRDFFIIDSNRNILYRTGTNTLNPGYQGFTSRINIFFTNEYIVIAGKYENPLDLDIEAEAVFDTGVIINKIKETEMKTFFIINGKIYKNSDFSTDFIKDVMRNKITGGRFIKDSRIVDSYPVSLAGSYIGTLGFVYPDRSLEAAFLLAFKIISIGAILILLFILDRFLVKSLKIKKENVKQIKNITKPGVDEEDDGNHLDWLENYVKKSEEKNEK